MAIKEHKGLMALFKASFEGVAFNVDTFDSAYFLDSAKDLIDELENKVSNNANA